MIKDFTPFYNFWTTATKWFKNKDVWNNVAWEEIDAPACEKFVEEAFMIFGQYKDYFEERKLQDLYFVSRDVYNEIEEFRSKVPLMVSLRN